MIGGKGWWGQLSNICDNNLEAGIEAWPPPANLESAYMDSFDPFLSFIAILPYEVPLRVVRILLFPGGYRSIFFQSG